eukprot:6209-Heterococcus_DN1.PRE.1
MHKVTQRTLTSLHTCVCTTAILCVHVQQQQQEVQHGDDLLLLAAHALRDLYQLTEAAAANADMTSDVASDARLHAYLLRVETAALLEFGMACSPSRGRYSATSSSDKLQAYTLDWLCSRLCSGHTSCCQHAVNYIAADCFHSTEPNAVRRRGHACSTQPSNRYGALQPCTSSAYAQPFCRTTQY